MNSKHLWSVIIASEDSYDSHDQWSHMIAMNTDCEQSLFIGTAMNLDSERSMIKHIIHDEVGSMLWNAGVHTWSTLILYHIMTPMTPSGTQWVATSFKQNTGDHMASIHSTLGHLYSNSRDHQRLAMGHINFDIYTAWISFRYIFLCLSEGQTFWSEGSAYIHLNI